MQTSISFCVMNYFRTFLVFRKSIVIAIPFATYICKVGGAYIQTCNEGMYTMSFDNGSWGCVSCKDCPRGFKITLPCRYNRDTVCEKCPKETFVTKSGNDCQPCSRCQPGYYIDKQCGAQEDRQCQKCSDGYYSRHWNSLTCRRCAHCKKTEKLMRPCDGRNNSICGGCIEDHYREASTWDCAPCSKCEGEDYIIVKECRDKLGIESQYLCKAQLFYKRKNTTKTAFVDLHQSETDSTAAHTELLLVIVVAGIVIAALIVLIFISYMATWRFLRKPRRILRKSGPGMFTGSAKIDNKTLNWSLVTDETEKNDHRQFQTNVELKDSKTNQKPCLYVETDETSTCKGDYQHKETDFLLNDEKKSHQGDISKKRKKKIKREVQSDCDYISLGSNRFAVLENSKYTTI